MSSAATASVDDERPRTSEVVQCDEGFEEISTRHELIRWLKGMGYRADEVPIPADHLERWALPPDEVSSLSHLASHPRDPTFVVLLVEHERLAQPELRAWQTRWAGRLWRRNRTFRGLLLSAEMVASDGGDPRYGRIVLSVPFSAGQVSQPGLHHLRLGDEEVRPADAERISRLRVTGDDIDGFALARRLRTELDIEHVTRSFFRRFVAQHDKLSTALAELPNVSKTDRDELALTILSRLLFAYFLERQGLLDHDTRFFRRRVAAIVADGGGLYDRLLRPLFFGLLNTPRDDRTAEALALGEVPYLNGGLFDPTPLERQHGITLADDVVIGCLSNLFERFSFTTHLDGGELGVDPEMLGRVFEALMAEGERGRTGTFYTPRHIVEALVVEALTAYLESVGVPSNTADRLLAEEPSEPILLDDPECVYHAVDQVTVLDPSCGSGAFLLTMLQKLEMLHVRLAQLNGDDVPPRSALRRRIVAKNLYGVDLKPRAVRLCELRLWLGIVDAREPGAPLAPLPNLDHRVRSGNALLSPWPWVSLPGGLRVLSADVGRLARLKDQYTVSRTSTNASASKLALRRGIDRAEARLCRALLQSERERIAARFQQLHQVATSPDLFGETHAVPRLARDLDKTQGLLTEVDEALARLDRGEKPNLSFAVHFPEVFVRDGFDIVVGNPPWVRIHDIPMRDRRQLRRQYAVVQRPSWTAAGMLKDLAGFAAQVDLSACFVERSLTLLRDDGVMALLLPSKLLRALYGGGVRRLLLTQTRLRCVAELAERQFPDAKTYPAAIVATRRRPAADDHVRLGLHSGASEPVASLPVHDGDVAAPWVLGSARTRDLALLRSGALLGQHPTLRVSGGAKTGCNSAFVIDEPADDLTPHTLPLLRGADIDAFRIEPASRIIWTHDRAIARPMSEIPPAILRSLRPWEQRLRARSDLRACDPWWRLFRTTRGMFEAKVVWRDIGKRLTAAAVPATVDGEPVIPLNTVYFIALPSFEQAIVLAGWMNSTIVRSLAETVAERAATGRYRFFSWVMSLLPMPEALFSALVSERAWKRAVADDPWIFRLLEVGRELCLQPPHPDEYVTDLDEAVEQLYLRGRS